MRGRPHHREKRQQRQDDPLLHCPNKDLHVSAIFM
jgi:hypothetical protein